MDLPVDPVRGQDLVDPEPQSAGFRVIALHLGDAENVFVRVGVGGKLAEAAVPVRAAEHRFSVGRDAVVLPIGGDGPPEQIAQGPVDLLQGQDADGLAVFLLFKDGLRVVGAPVSEGEAQQLRVLVQIGFQVFDPLLGKDGQVDVHAALFRVDFSPHMVPGGLRHARLPGVLIKLAAVPGALGVSGCGGLRVPGGAAAEQSLDPKAPRDEQRGCQGDAEKLFPAEGMIGFFHFMILLFFRSVSKIQRTGSAVYSTSRRSPPRSRRTASPSAIFVTMPVLPSRSSTVMTGSSPR